MIGEGPPPTKYGLFEDANMRKGAKWGAGIGWVIAMLHISANSAVGFYNGSVLLVFLVCVGGGVFLGITYGWYISKRAKESGEFWE